MILGLSTSMFTLLHVIISLVGISAGLIALLGLLGGKLYRGLTALFLITTVLTSVTGFLFPFHGMSPGIILGILSILVLVLGHRGALCGETCRRVARDLHHHFEPGALFQFLRPGCASVCQNPRAEIHRAHASLSSIRNHSAGRAGRLPCADNSRLQEISQRVAGTGIRRAAPSTSGTSPMPLPCSCRG
jgi:hypothetical protein